MGERTLDIRITWVGRLNWKWEARHNALWLRPVKDGEPFPPPKPFMLPFRSGRAFTRAGAIRKARRAAKRARRRHTSIEIIDLPAGGAL